MKKRVLRVLPAFVMAGVFAAPVSADVDSRTYFVPAVSYVGADEDRLADDNVGLQLGFGKAVSDRWNMEFSLVGDILEQTDTDNKYEQAGVLIDGLFFFTRNPGFAPYAVIGAGAMNTSFGGDNNNVNPMANIGLGFFRQLTQGGTQLRFDARYRVDEDDRTVVGGETHERFEDWLVNLGLAIPFGAAPQPEPAPAPEPVAEAAPAPAPVPVVVDSDADGVPDEQDACAGTPVGAKVDAKGCELDSDGDGVVDSKDKCPNTAAGIKVDTKGCEIPDVVVLHGVNFVSGSDKLLPESLAILDEVAASLLKHPNMVVEVAGYTDSTGSRAFNERLSYRRAKSVRSYLITKGVSPDNLIAKGYGPANPVASNSTAQGRAENRRVELHTLKK
ncbi:MAG TPA: hypothetical protein ENJ24_01065 [Gammaproteobacteria bacterium]|nr:hypothetical protein [Gammaproteobacteria bacterium]